MAISDRLNEITTHLERDYTNIEALGIDVNVDKNIENIAKVLDDVWESQDHVTGTGESLSLNTKKGKAKVDLLGNTSQITTTGKNLLRYTLPVLKSVNTDGTWSGNVYTLNGLTFTVLGDLSIKVNGTATGETYTRFGLFQNVLSFDANTQIFMSGCPANGSSSTYRLRFNVTGDEDTGSGKSINRSSAWSSGIFIQVETGTQCSAILFKPQIELGSSATSYEMPIGVTPSPDYPQEINVVKGDNEIVNCGINMADFSSFVYGFPVANGELSTSHTYNEKRSPMIPVKPNTQYTFIIDDVTFTYSNWMGIAEYQDSIIEGNPPTEFARSYVKRSVNSSNNKYLTITTTAITHYVVISARNLVDGAKVCLLEGSSTTYVPYISQVYPINLGTKNLLNLTQVKPAGTTYNIKEPTLNNGVINVQGNNSEQTATSYMNGYVEIFGVDEWKANTTYYCSFKVDIVSNPKSISNFLCYLAGSRDGYANYNSTTGRYETAITMSSNPPTQANKMYLEIRVASCELNISEVMISTEKTSSYTPYGVEPIELCKIGDYKDGFVRTSGKNLYNNENTIATVGATIVKNSTGFTFTRTSAGSNDTFMATYEVDLKPNTTYSIYSKKNNFTSYFYFYSDTLYGNALDKTSIQNIQAYTAYKFTTDSTGHVLIGFYVSGISQGSSGTFDNIVLYEGEKTLVELEVYEPYGNGDWYLKKEIGEYIYNNDMAPNGLFDNYTAFLTPILNIGALIDLNAFSNMSMCNMLPTKMDSNYTGFSGTTASKKIRVNLSTNIATTYEEGYTLFANKNLTIYYAYETRTYTKLNETYPALTSQLEAAWRANTYSTTTNISQVNNDLPFELFVTALEAEESE